MLIVVNISEKDYRLILGGAETIRKKRKGSFEEMILDGIPLENIKNDICRKIKFDQSKGVIVLYDDINAIFDTYIKYLTESEENE